MSAPLKSPRLNIGEIKREEIPSHAEESARLYQPLVVEVTMPNGKIVTYDECSTGFTVEMIKFRACDEFDLKADGAKIFFGDQHLTPDPLSFNDFPAVMNRSEQGPLKLRLEYAEPL